MFSVVELRSMRWIGESHTAAGGGRHGLWSRGAFLAIGRSHSHYHPTSGVLASLEILLRRLSPQQKEGHMENQGARSQFSGGGQFKENSRKSNEATGAAVSDSIARGTDAVGAAAKDAMNSAGSDLQSLQADFN